HLSVARGAPTATRFPYPTLFRSEARRGAWWDANKIGLSPPPIETPRGWLVLYHGVRHTPSGCLYRLGLALFDLEKHQPSSRCLKDRKSTRQNSSHVAISYAGSGL